MSESVPLGVTTLIARARHQAGAGPTWRLDILLRELADALESNATRVAELEAERLGTRQRVVDRDQYIASLDDAAVEKCVEVVTLKARVAEFKAKLDQANAKSERLAIKAESSRESRFRDALEILGVDADKWPERQAKDIKSKLDRETKPRPMSEAPRDGEEFLALVPIHYKVHEHGRGFFDRCGDAIGFNLVHPSRKPYAVGWLPASGGIGGATT